MAFNKFTRRLNGNMYALLFCAVNTLPPFLGSISFLSNLEQKQTESGSTFCDGCINAFSSMNQASTALLISFGMKTKEQNLSNPKSHTINPDVDNVKENA